MFAGRSRASWIARGYLIPRAAAFGFTVKRVQGFMFRAASQVRVAYHDSALSIGVAGAVRGGDRLPWVPGGGGGEGGGEHRAAGDNFEPLRSLDWQVHVYGQVTPEVRAMARRRGLAVFELPWNEQARAAGLAWGAAYLVRPDGHVSVAAPAQGVASIGRLLDDYQAVTSVVPALKG